MYVCIVLSVASLVVWSDLTRVRLSLVCATTSMLYVVHFVLLVRIKLS